MKKKALFITVDIRSHVLPSFFLADILSKEYDITYAVKDKIIEDLVVENGYKSTVIPGFRIGVNSEASYIQNRGEVLSFFRLMKSYLTDEIYWHRKKILDELLEQVRPDIVIMDVFGSTDFFLLHHYEQIKFMFFNPMPSIYQVDGYPIVSEGVWLKESKKHESEIDLKFIDFFKFPKLYILKWLVKEQVVKFHKLSQISKKHSLVKNRFTKLFNNVPELLLIPLEFEFSKNVKKDNQHYLGLCHRESRKETELDETFDANWQDILNKKNEGYNIIYCSFGTYFRGADRRLLNFVNVIFDAVNSIPNTFLICSVNKYVIEVIHSQNKVLGNSLFFSKVPQLEVLKIANLYITHGGMGGIKESIFYEVPMIVYPLDLNYDQNGNALKVEYHKLGLRGVFGNERAIDMREKIIKLLDDVSFKSNIEKFKNQTSEVYSEKYFEKLLDRLLNK
jgi:UDP:flavonoid glycosyltransferase YjiC (YdhE family)